MATRMRNTLPSLYLARGACPLAGQWGPTVPVPLRGALLVTFAGACPCRHVQVRHSYWRGEVEVCWQGGVEVCWHGEVEVCWHGEVDV
jgi:hypothetical protein